MIIKGGYRVMYESEVIDIIKSEVAFMGTIDENRPHVRPMKPYIDHEGHIWLFSRYDSRKVSDLLKNPRIELCFLDKKQQVLNIYGRLKDETKAGSPTFQVIRDIMLHDMPEMKHYFKDEDKDSLVIYRLIVHEVRFMKADCEVTTRVNLPMEHDPDTELSMCQGGFCLVE